MRKTKKTLIFPSILILLSLFVGVFSFVWAYYSNEKQVDNVMETSTSEMVLNEIFNENDNWVVGETKQKEVSFKNTGEIEQLLIFTITEAWLEQDENGEWVPWDEAEDSAATVNYTDYLEDEWTYINGNYYYNTTISPDVETNIVIESVTFSSSINNGSYSNSLDYSDKKYSLIVSMEAIEVSSDVALEEWDVTYTQDSDGTITWSEVIGE